MLLKEKDKNIQGAEADEQGVLYRHDGRQLVCCDNKTLRHYAIKDGTEVIAERAFASCNCLEEVIIPDSVTTIGERAFHGCKSLTYFFIPKSVTLIEDRPFQWCDNLTQIVVHRDNPAYCSVDGVLYSKDMTTLVCCPAAAPFSSYVIPESVTTIRPYAFWYCHHLTRVTISRNVVSIGRDAFLACSSLTHVDYLATACEQAGELINGAFGGSIQKVCIGQNVEQIPDFLFRGCSSLKEIAIPENVTHIGKYAFSHCSSLERISLPSSIAEIADSMFSECENLETISLPESIVSIGGSAFFKCTKLKTISLPNSVTSIGDLAFYGCTGLTECVLSPNTTHIGEFAFSDCESLTHLSLPDGLTHVGAFAFLRCDKLSTIKIPRSVTFIGECAFCHQQPLNVEIEEGNNAYCVHDDVLYTKDMTTLVEYLNLSQRGTFVVPDLVKIIGEHAFNHCALSSIVLSNGVTHIGRSAFETCKELTSVTLPQTLTYVGNKCFANSWRLHTLTSLSPIPPHCDDILFNFDEDGEEDTSTFYSCTLRVPKGSREAYASADEWREFENIEEIDN